MLFAHQGIPALLALAFSSKSARPLVDVPMILDGVHVSIMAKVNGRGPFPMNIDTGGHLVVTPALAKRLDIRSSGDVVGGGAGAGTVKYGYAKGLTIEVGSVKMTNVDGIINNDTSTTLAAGIGPELFLRYTVEFDYDNLRVRIYPKGVAPQLNGSTALPIRLKDNEKPLVFVKIGSIGGWFMADTGGGISLIIQRNFWRPHALDQKIRPLVKAIVGYGIGGPIYGRMARIPVLQLGSIQLPGMLASLSDMTKGSLADTGRDGLLGQDILRRFNVTFDYANRRMILVPNKLFTAPAPYGRAGMSGYVEGLGYQVTYVCTGSPAEKAGLKAGDVIITIDENRVTSALAKRAIFRPVGTRLNLVVLRDDRQFSTTMILQKVL